MQRSLLKLLPLAFAALSCAVVQSDAAAAESAPRIWVNPGIYSHHFNRSNDYRGNNIGLGAEVLLTDDHALMAGSFINSDRQRSQYGLYQWRPLHWQFAAAKVSLGIAAGAFDGYPRYRSGGWFAAVLPLVSVEGERFGVNLAIVPNIPDRLGGAVAAQIKLRVW